jgi:putative ABC transport system permease protein
VKIVGEIVEGVRIALEAIRANVLRSTLTTLGIVIGVVTVTMMATAMEGLDRSFRDAVSFLGTDVLYVDQRDWFIGSQQKWESVAKRTKITLEQARAVERYLGNVRAIAPTVMQNVDGVRYKDRSSSMALIIGTTEQFLITGGITIERGRFMTKQEAFARRDICIIGAEVASSLFPDEDPMGKRIRVANEALEVIGIIEKRGSVLGGMSLDNQVVIPIGKMVTGFRREPSCTVQVKIGDPSRVAAVREELRGVMRKIRRVRPGQDDDFAINQQEQLVTQFRQVSGVIATSGFFITGLSLFVGGIGIMNIMFVSVAERTQEIGVRKAIGAKRRAILLQFLIEAGAICVLGGLIALCLAWIGVIVARQYLPTVSLSFRVIGIALGVALVTGLISGFLPAWRAAHMRPVDALRNE